MKQRKPYQRKLRGKTVWYILWEGRQTWLGRYKEEAFDNWKLLQAGEPIVRPGQAEPMSAKPTVRELADKFLAWVKANRKPATYKLQKHYLDSFCDRVGSLKVTALKKHHLQEWLDDNTARSDEPWNSTTANTAARSVVRCFNWAVKLDHLDKSPVRGFEKPKAKSRDCYLTGDEWKRLLKAADKDPDFKDTLLFLRLTGARPQEMRLAEKRHFDASIPAIVYPRDEAKGERYERVIHLAGEALLIVKKRCLAHPEGPIFRNCAGNPWIKDSLSRKFSRLRKRLKIPHLMPYTIRHTFGTDALVNGQDALTVAELMGHTSTKMLESVYQKIRRRRDYMQQAAAKAVENIA